MDKAQIEEKLNSFKWIDEEDSNVNQPKSEIASQLLECAYSVAEYVQNNPKVDSLNNNVISIDIPLSVHNLLAEKRNNKWSADSRDSVFEAIRGCFISVTDDQSYRQRLENKISDKLRKKITELDLEKINKELNECKRSVISFTSDQIEPVKINWMRMYDDSPSSIQVNFENSSYRQDIEREIVVEIGLNNV